MSFIAPQQCPTCQGALSVRELVCENCATVVRGTWTSNPFGRLSVGQQTFLKLFVRSRGNLSEVERALGVSYPTVRAKLEDVIHALSDDVVEPEAESVASRDEILQRVERGEMTVDQAMSEIRRQMRPADGDE